MLQESLASPASIVILTIRKGDVPGHRASQRVHCLRPITSPGVAMDAHMPKIMAKAGFHQNSGTVVQRLAGRAKHFVHDAGRGRWRKRGGRPVGQSQLLFLAIVTPPAARSVLAAIAHPMQEKGGCRCNYRGRGGASWCNGLSAHRLLLPIPPYTAPAICLPTLPGWVSFCKRIFLAGKAGTAPPARRPSDNPPLASSCVNSRSKVACTKCPWDLETGRPCKTRRSIWTLIFMPQPRSWELASGNPFH